MQWQVFVCPASCKNPFVKSVTDFRHAIVAAADEADCHKLTLQRRFGIGFSADTLAYLAIEIEQCFTVLPVSGNHLVDVAHVRFVLNRRTSCKLVHRNAVDMRLDISGNTLACN